MIVRPAKTADTERIGELWLELVNYHRDLDSNMPTAAKDGHHRYAQRIRYGLSDSYQRILVTEIDGKIVAYATAMIIDIVPEMFVAERAGMIGDIYVEPSQRGKGIGSALMQVMVEWFKLRGVSYYELSVASTNAAGIRFWEKQMKAEKIMFRMRSHLNYEKD